MHNFPPTIRIIVGGHKTNLYVIYEPEYGVKVFFERAVASLGDELSKGGIISGSVSFLTEVTDRYEDQLVHNRKGRCKLLLLLYELCRCRCKFRIE
jgi:hypothetical protein